MTSWLIGVPAWGDHYVNMAKTVALPSILAALKQSPLPAKLVIHTDRYTAFADLLDEPRVQVGFLPADPTKNWEQYPLTHHELTRMAARGDYVSPLCADAAVSAEFFKAQEAFFEAGKKVVVSEGTRTLSDAPPPIGVEGKELTEWALSHMHPFNRENFWETGRSTCHSVLYFCDGQSLVKHCFHMGPMGFVKDDRNYRLDSSTDGTFMDSFTPEEIQIAQPWELSICECSPNTREVPVQPQPFTKDEVVVWARTCTTAIHRLLFRQPIILAGYYSGKSKLMVDIILRELGTA